GDLVDKILDKAGQKGTGKWTAQESLEFGVPIPTIAASVDARALSSMKEERMKAAREFSDRGLLSQSLTLTKDGTAQGDLEHALYAGKVVAYAQGMALIQRASSEFGWNVELDKIAGLWRAGCIIRADMLQDIMSAFRADQNLPNLIVSSLFKENLKIALPSLRRVVVAGVESGIPLPCLSASLSYLDSYLSANLPQNLIQAQRDYFGAHTYERNDREGVFHSKWEE
ncbi:MAG: NADP-dependent phosphogluconate dehydrogenase, partial [Bdellovibrionales bacterium]|nr:NADP-dependent phosphogluconate dehydrogenase [Bdellovibrionales bacterium]